MKSLLIASLFSVSLSAFSQSYVILNNGVTLTTDRAGLVYDFGNFNLPYNVSVRGGQFLVISQKLATVDFQGFFYSKDLEIRRVKGHGVNYLVDDKDVLITIDSNGFFYRFDKDKNVTKNITRFGGNFFVVKASKKKDPSDLYTLNTLGNYFKLSVAGLNPDDITVTGGMYFQTNRGVIYTVSKDGFVFPKPEMKTGVPRKLGGNFFIDSNSALYTISEEGILSLPALPANLKVGAITQVGVNYMIDSEGRMFTVDTLGNISERKVNHDMRNARILSR